MRLHFSPKQNFGDALNPSLWNWVYPNLEEVSNGWDFFGVGTLLKKDMHSTLDCPKLVMGSGYGYGNAVKIDKNWNFGFVRGIHTCRKLKIPESFGIGDPAVLLLEKPEIKKMISKSGNKNLLIPHHRSEESADWKRLAGLLDFNFCSPTESVDQIVKAISCSKTVFTESLHGAIFADSLNIPWVPIFSAKYLNFFKWKDWCSSVNVKFCPLIFPRPFYSRNIPLTKQVASLPKLLLGKIGLIKRYKLTPFSPINDDQLPTYAQEISNLFNNAFPSLSTKQRKDEILLRMQESLVNSCEKYGLCMNQNLT
jgi:hypothetical protein